jgi:hypothetical protein
LSSTKSVTFRSDPDRAVGFATTASALVPPTGGLMVTVCDEVEVRLPVSYAAVPVKLNDGREPTDPVTNRSR